MASPTLQRGRFSQIGAYYTVTAITDRRRLPFANPLSAQIVIPELNPATRDHGFEPLAWVLMPDHLHIVLRLGDTSLSRSIQTLKSRAARAFNSAHGTAGTVWQAGFYDHCIRSDEDLFRQARYVIENPVRRGLVARREAYPYSWCRWIPRPPIHAL